MKSFAPFIFDPHICRSELNEFKTLLDTINEPKEGEHLLPLFKRCPNMVSLLGYYAFGIAEVDQIAFELSVSGDFACDIVVGDSRSKAYCLIEMEDAGANSIFRRNGNKATREWSPRFEHGFSQMVDWFYRLGDMRQTNAFESLFGRQARFEGMLLIGRRNLLEHEEAERLLWRVDKVLVDSNKVHCVTFDELLKNMEFQLNRYALPSSAG